MKYSKSSNKIILIGPLPPGWGGARVSFKIFFDYIKENLKLDFLHFDLPIRNDRNKNPPGKVNYFKTLLKSLGCALRLPFAPSIIVFGSRDFCYTYGLMLLVISKLFRKPFYIRFFGGHPAQSNLLRNSLLRRIVFKLLSRADRIIVETHAGASEFPKYLTDKILVVVGYRPSPQLVQKPRLFSNEIVRLVYVGEVSFAKGVHHLLKSFSELYDRVYGKQEIELHIFGAGSREIIENVQTKKNVHYHGKVDNQTLLKALNDYDIFVFPSTYVNEGHPGAVIEALMVGLPVVASDLLGVKEVVRHMENGLLVRAGDNRQLADAMQLLVENEELRKQLSKGALKSSEAFKAENVLPQLARAVGIKE